MLVAPVAAGILAGCNPFLGCGNLPAVEQLTVEPNYIECVPGQQVSFVISYKANPSTYAVGLEEGAPTKGPGWNKDGHPAPNDIDLPAKQDSFQRTVPCQYGDYPITLTAFAYDMDNVDGSWAYGAHSQVAVVVIRPPGTATGPPSTGTPPTTRP